MAHRSKMKRYGDIVSDVRREGDAALLRYTEQLDRVKLTAAAAARDAGRDSGGI